MTITTYNVVYYFFIIVITLTSVVIMFCPQLFPISSIRLIRGGIAPFCQTWMRYILRSHILRIGKNPQGSGSKHSRRKDSECDFLLGFHCISSMKTAARPVYIPKTQKSYLPHIYRAWRSLAQSPVPVSNLHAPYIGSFLKYTGIISSILHPLTPVSAVWFASGYSIPYPTYPVNQILQNSYISPHFTNCSHSICTKRL